jgi:hypothetical protein
MKTLKQILIAATVVLVASCNAYAQKLSESSTYNTAIGLRAGGTSGITVKHFTGSSTALEGIVGIWNRGLSVTLLMEKHVSAFNVSGLNWYYGGGGHVAMQSGAYYFYDGRYRVYRSGELGLGVDGIVGLEYKITPIPIAVSLDIKPLIEVTTLGSVFWGLDPGLGIKFAF